MKPTRAAPIRAVKTVGFWLAIVMALLQALNAVRSIASPVTFATYMGLPLANVADTGFVYVYGLRAGFISILIIFLVGMKRFSALSWVALAAMVMPIGDAVLAHNAGAPISTVIRHAAIAFYVLIAFFVLRRTAAAGFGE